RGRLALLASIREFASERLDELGRRPQAIERHARVYLGEALGWAAAFRSRAERAGAVRLAAEQTQLVAVFERGAPASNPGGMVDAITCLEPVWTTRGRSAELAALAEVAALHDEALDVSRRARLHLVVGTCVGLQGRLTEAIPALERAAALADGSG